MWFARGEQRVTQFFKTLPTTEPEWTEWCRTASFDQKLRVLSEMMALARELHAQRMLRWKPDATPREIKEDHMYLTLGPEVMETLRRAGRLP
jgi:hypothetical protein